VRVPAETKAVVRAQAVLGRTGSTQDVADHVITSVEDDFAKASKDYRDAGLGRAGGAARLTALPQSHRVTVLDLPTVGLFGPTMCDCFCRFTSGSV
jgi:hypothetical protein